MVAAAGNEYVNTNTATSPSGSYSDSLMPAGLRHIMSIGATGPIDQQYFDTIAAYSNYGDAGVGVFAPGGNVIGEQQDRVLGACSSAWYDSNARPPGYPCIGSDTSYAIGAGTSFATPMVSGEAAVIEGQNDGLIKGPALETCVSIRPPR